MSTVQIVLVEQEKKMDAVIFFFLDFKCRIWNCVLGLGNKIVIFLHMGSKPYIGCVIDKSMKRERRRKHKKNI